MIAENTTTFSTGGQNVIGVEELRKTLLELASHPGWPSGVATTSDLKQGS